MTVNQLCFPTILFDWGNTVMLDDPASTIPMVEWQTVEVIESIAYVLEYLHPSGRRIVLARGGLASYFSRIYCFKNTNLSKGEALYRHILSDLSIPATDALMVGDGFEKDVQAANAVGIFTACFNPRSEETCPGELYITVHSMGEFLEFFRSLDKNN